MAKDKLSSVARLSQEELVDFIMHIEAGISYWQKAKLLHKDRNLIGALIQNIRDKNSHFASGIGDLLSPNGYTYLKYI
jgi:hypothetical protein